MGRLTSSHDPFYPHHRPTDLDCSDFAAKAVARGGVIRRNIAWVDAEVGRDRFVSEVRKRGYYLVQTGQQFVVICHTGTIHILF
jgi:hypothetical protein